MLFQFLEQLGVTFEMDWDGEVIIEVPEELDHVDVMEAIEKEPFGKKLSREFQRRSQVERSVFVGGLLNGQSAYGRLEYRWIPNRVKRARWEVYELSSDGRAFFRGYATSQAKAKRGEITEQTASKEG